MVFTLISPTLLTYLVGERPAIRRLTDFATDKMSVVIGKNVMFFVYKKKRLGGPVGWLEEEHSESKRRRPLLCRNLYLLF
jgi:hypothetical protein